MDEMDVIASTEAEIEKIREDYRMDIRRLYWRGLLIQSPILGWNLGFTLGTHSLFAVGLLIFSFLLWLRSYNRWTATYDPGFPQKELHR